MKKYSTDEDTGCWVWTGAFHKTGYPLVSLAGRQLLAHRAIYELLVGPIGAGCHVHHICRNRACINPEHLRALDSRAHGETRRQSVGTSALEQLLEEHNRYTEGDPLTIRTLAEASGVPERTVYRHIRGEVTMKAPHVAAYAKALGISPARLVEA